MVNINGITYYLDGDVQGYTPSVKVGEIKEQTKSEVKPVRHMRSNVEVEGSEVYTTKESIKHYIVKNPDTGETFLYTLEENITLEDDE